jgi:integrase
MPDFGEIKWEVKEKFMDLELPSEDISVDFFLNYCETKLPSQNLFHSFEKFIVEKNKLHDEFKKSIETISQQPFLVAFLAWIHDMAAGSPDKNSAKILLENNLIGIKTEQGQTWTVAHARTFDHRYVIDVIRCRREWTFQLKENLVLAYIKFIQWLWKVTFGYIPKLEDPDLLRIQGRALSYQAFIHLLSKLNEKDQLVAKLLYFGGSRTLEEVLNLNIEEVDFDKRLIYFDLQPISYPLHVFADVKAIAQDPKGRIFIGRRQNVSLNPATIFRNFKEAATEIGLGQNFTPKVLTTNI